MYCNETSTAAGPRTGGGDGLFWKAEAKQNGSAAGTDVSVLTKSLPEADKQPHFFRPINSCYNKAFCFFFGLESRR